MQNTYESDLLESVSYLLQVAIYVSLRLRVQNGVPAQPCVGKLGISLVSTELFAL